jgi:hypothetical protein
LAPSIRGFDYDLMEPYNNISLSKFFGEVDSFLLEHVLLNLQDLLTYDAIIDIPTLCQY